MSWQKKKTNKLFFDTYVYKIAFKTFMAYGFRNKNYPLLLADLDTYDDQLRKNKKEKMVFEISWRSRTIERDDLEFARSIVDILENTEDYGLRVEGNNLSIYSNDEQLIDDLASVYDHKVISVTKPESPNIREFLLNNHKRIIARNYTHKYRVTINPLRSQALSFYDWAEKIPSIKLLRRNPHVETYFYVGNEKTLALCRLFLGSSIRRVDEMITREEISA